MFGPKNVPKGVLSARPPAKGTASFLSSVWQPAQPPAFARYSPRFASPWAKALTSAAQSTTASAPCPSAFAFGRTVSIRENKAPPQRGFSENPRSVLLAEILVAVPATPFANLGD